MSSLRLVGKQIAELYCIPNHFGNSMIADMIAPPLVAKCHLKHCPIRSATCAFCQIRLCKSPVYCWHVPTCGVNCTPRA